MIDRKANNHENLQLLFEESPLTGRVLIVDDFPAEIDALTNDDAQITYWHTRYNTSHDASTTPPGDTMYDQVLIRLPKSHEYFDFVLQMISSRISPQGNLYVYGLNDEGIKGASKKLKEFYGNVETVLIKNHGRILLSEITKEFDEKNLSNFSSSHTVTYKEKGYEMVYYPGMFAHGSLDVGTTLLLDQCLPFLQDKAQVLDYACGSGIIGKILYDHNGTVVIDAIDNDSLSLEAAKVNAPHISELILADSFVSVSKDKKYDLIVSNPPIHTEKELQYETLNSLIEGSYRHLKQGGRLLIVVQARIKIEERLENTYGNCTTLAETTRFKVLEGIR